VTFDRLFRGEPTFDQINRAKRQNARRLHQYSGG